MSTRSTKLVIAATLIALCMAVIGGAVETATRARKVSDFSPPIPVEPFSPSNARTEDGRFIDADEFFPASRCAACHRDTHTGWAESLHRNAAREPFYRESADILLRTRGIEFTRHCESCHTPVALFSGALTGGTATKQAPFTPLDDEGVTCSVCHSIIEARLDGTGSYTIRRPALIARQDGSPVYGDMSDQEILADIEGHKRAVMRPLMKTPEFCSVCHKVTAPPELNGYKNIRGFSAYDEWQQSSASQESVTPFYTRASRADCRACHMPKIESADDRAAKNGLISSHRWLGANTAAPLFYGQTAQARLTEAFLKANVIAVDIFALTSEASGARIAPADCDEPVAFKPGDEITAEVVVSNRNAAHSFPPEVRDLYEAWVEFEAIDESGETIFHSGFLNPDRMLDESAHVYKTILLDEAGRMITRHQIWLTAVKAYDNAILPGRSDLVRYRFRMPEGAKKSLLLRARVNYRRLNQEYSDYVLNRQKRHFTLPVVRMAEVEIEICEGKPKAAKTAATAPARRWNDYGIALLEQSDFGAAAEAFRRASRLSPTDASLMVNAAIAEMRTERFGPDREQLAKAYGLIDRALQLDPDNLRTRFYNALLLRADGRAIEASAELSAIARLRPRDREVLRQLGQTLYTMGKISEARAAFEAVVFLDPTDAAAYQFLVPIYLHEGRKTEADRTRSLYLLWRDDPLADSIAARFFAARPEWAEERTWSHSHGAGSPRRLILTDSLAAPDR